MEGIGCKGMDLEIFSREYLFLCFGDFLVWLL